MHMSKLTKLVGTAALAVTLPLAASTVQAQETTAPTPYSIIVNSAADGAVRPDDALTLREAIEVINGTLPVTELSGAERARVVPAASPVINFSLPSETTIALAELLPPIMAAGTLVDGSSQPGYGPISTTDTMVTPVPTPMVTLTPAPGAEVPRGLTITADDVTVRGLSIYGFSARHRSTQTTPPADIFITHVSPPVDAGLPAAPGWQTLQPDEDSDAPVGVVIEDNWLGLSPSGQMPPEEQLSALGIFVFNGLDTVIQRNRIEFHEGSGIITGAQAMGMDVTENTMRANGLAGIPDGIRLDGNIDGAQIHGNLICATDGSGVFMFKPEGSARIYNNDIRFNGRRLRRAAVYLMGSGHEVTGNVIQHQPGPGVAIAAYPHNTGNIIRDNQFAALDGLSVDLGYNDESRIQDFQRTDGPNPPRNSSMRRRDTANGAINAPEFDDYTFPISGGQATLSGIADPGTAIDIYTVVDRKGYYGALNQYVTTVTTDDTGSFNVGVDAPDGTIVSALATDDVYGTSEPSAITAIGTLGDGPRSPQMPSCEIAQDPPEPEPELPPEQVILRIPRNIHFALDKSDLSAASIAIMDDIIAVLQEYPFITVELQGHTDPRASNAYNQALGERRALAARNYLLQQGVAPERMRIRSFGETQRRSSGTGRVDYARDRRTEFIFTDTRGLEIIYENLETDLQIEP
ncbi:OmpA family protein [Leptothoe sp. PORK10 BA2]|uniref:OmpA family protein n=1 Tax=Leptothoe sp. PORK10 BA2 TaxID=3110254 RepID=UPI002B1F85AB|nr:OmpA family protein [Leptothoe sp. PORK10 BA2]MEA5462457.1 OmpA family protein [Leptothoe sp. PORK10 BA2]